MTHYSDKADQVRVDFFKQSGKWYTTEAVIWTGKWDGTTDIHESFSKSLRDHFKETPDRLSEMDAICLDPYHEHTHPIQIRKGGWIEKIETPPYIPKVKDQVIYVPPQAEGEINHPDCERGFVMKINEMDPTHVFCRFFHKPPGFTLRTTSCSENTPLLNLFFEKHRPQNQIDKIYKMILEGIL